ncbi:MAG: glycosyltransferase family 4 protein [Nonlabens sp.]
MSVLYCAKTEPRRYWKFNAKDQKYNYSFLPGIHPNFKGFYPHINLSVGSVLKDLKPQVLIISGAWNTPTMLMALFGYNYPTTKLFWTEGHPDAQVTTNRIIGWLRGKVYRRFDGFCVPNNKTAAYVDSIINHRTAIYHILPNTIDESNFRDKWTPGFSRLSTTRNVEVVMRQVVTVCSLVDRKGVMELLEGYHLLDPDTRDHLKLVFVGTGDLDQQLREFAKRNSLLNVIFRGHIDADGIREVLQKSDAFILATKRDPNPLTPIEASLMKLPIALSVKAGNHDEIIKPDTGWSIKYIDKVVIKATLQKIYETDQEQLRLMGLAAHDNAMQYFGQRSVVKKFTHFLKELIK